MDKGHALTLLVTKLEQEGDITDELEYMPLAIAQAAAYIKQRAPRCSVQQYLEKLQKSDKSRTRLLSVEYEALRRDWEAIDDFEADLLTLRDYSLISIAPDGSVFEMHRLVQLATRLWLRSQAQDERWKEKSIRNLDAALPDGKFENWANCRVLFPHAKLALGLKPEARDVLLHWASVLRKAAGYALRQGSYLDAEILATESVKARETVHGPDRAVTLRAMSLLAWVYLGKGQFTEAGRPLMRVLETSQRVQGEDNQHALVIMDLLASSYLAQERSKDAEALHERVMQTRRKVLGEEHMSTVKSMSNLASTYYVQGRLAKAEELQNQVLQIRKRKLGEEHPDTLLAQNNMANTYSAQGRWSEAVELLVRVVEISKKVLGERHPSTLMSMANLASARISQGNQEEALVLMHYCVTESSAVLGPDHPRTVTRVQVLKTWTDLDSPSPPDKGPGQYATPTRK